MSLESNNSSSQDRHIFPRLPGLINRESPRSMGSTTENINRRVETTVPMTRFSIGEDDEEAPIIFKRPRLSDAASQSRVLAGENDEDEMQDVVQVVESDSEDAVPVLRDAVVANRTDSPVIDSANVGMRVFFTDTDVLDCPICLEPLSSPVFQCENGHIACSSCLTKVNRKCPSCCMPIGYNRCRAVENIIESVKVSCKNAREGCRKIIAYSKQTEHEQVCPHAKCFCPHPSCPFSGSSKNLYLHFGSQHAFSTTLFTYNTTFLFDVLHDQKHMFLQEQDEGVVFILNHEVKEHGRALSVDCVGPSSLKTCFEYHITAGELGSTLNLRSVPEVYTKWSEHPLRKKYLTIPSGFYSCTRTGTMHVLLRIKKVVSQV